MAQAVLAKTVLRLVFEKGMDEKGKPVFKAKTFTNVKKDATTDQLHQAAQAMASLCNDPLNSIERNDSNEIIG